MTALSFILVHPFALIDPQNWSQTSQHPWGWSFPLLDLWVNSTRKLKTFKAFKLETSGLVAPIRSMLGFTGHVWRHWTSWKGQLKQKVTGWEENKLDHKTTWVEIHVMGPRTLCTVRCVRHVSRSAVFGHFAKIAALPCLPLGWQHLWLQLHQPATKTQNKQAILVVKDGESGCAFGLSQASWESLGHQKKTARNLMFKNPTAVELLTLKNFRISCSTCFNNIISWSRSNCIDFNSEVEATSFLGSFGSFTNQVSCLRSAWIAAPRSTLYLDIKLAENSTLSSLSTLCRCKTWEKNCNKM